MYRTIRNMTHTAPRPIVCSALGCTVHGVLRHCDTCALLCAVLLCACHNVAGTGCWSRWRDCIDDVITVHASMWLSTCTARCNCLPRVASYMLTARCCCLLRVVYFACPTRCSCVPRLSAAPDSDASRKLLRRAWGLPLLRATFGFNHLMGRGVVATPRIVARVWLSYGHVGGHVRRYRALSCRCLTLLEIYFEYIHFCFNACYALFACCLLCLHGSCLSPAPCQLRKCRTSAEKLMPLMDRGA